MTVYRMLRRPPAQLHDPSRSGAIDVWRDRREFLRTGSSEPQLLLEKYIKFKS